MHFQKNNNNGTYVPNTPCPKPRFSRSWTRNAGGYQCFVDSPTKGCRLFTQVGALPHPTLKRLQRLSMGKWAFVKEILGSIDWTSLFRFLESKCQPYPAVLQLFTKDITPCFWCSIAGPRFESHADQNFIVFSKSVTGVKLVMFYALFVTEWRWSNKYGNILRMVLFFFFLPVMLRKWSECHGWII